MGDPTPTPAPTPTPTPVPGDAPSKPTGLACVIGQDGQPQLTWDAAAGVTAWEVHDLANTAKTLQATVTVPRTVRSALKAGQHRRYAVVAVGPAAGPRCPTRSTCRPWGRRRPRCRLPHRPAPCATRPTSSAPGGTSPCRPGSRAAPTPSRCPRSPPTRASKYFELTPAGDGVVFRVWHGGVTTSGSARTHAPSCGSATPTGHWRSGPPLKGRHSMTVEGRSTGSRRCVRTASSHQIHGASDDVTVAWVEGDKLWITDGDNTHAYLVTERSPSASATARHRRRQTARSATATTAPRCRSRSRAADAAATSRPAPTRRRTRRARPPRSRPSTTRSSSGRSPSPTPNRRARSLPRRRQPVTQTCVTR
jgi:hypothetical protein